MAKKAVKRNLLFIVLLLIAVGAFVVTLGTVAKIGMNNALEENVAFLGSAVQSLARQELTGKQDDALIEQIEIVLDQLSTGEGMKKTSLPDSAEYQQAMVDARARWSEILQEIRAMRIEKDESGLVVRSQEFYDITERLGEIAIKYTEELNGEFRTILFASVSVLFACLIVGYVFAILANDEQRRHALSTKQKFIDDLTQINNRAGCENHIRRYANNTKIDKVTVFMFDLNRLKEVNKSLGFTGGDRLIAEFARILKQESDRYGFTGRYGGDEFISIFDDISPSDVENFLLSLNAKVVEMNMMRTKELEKISFAAGYCTGRLGETSIDSIINEADRQLTINKNKAADRVS